MGVAGAEEGLALPFLCAHLGTKILALLLASVMTGLGLQAPLRQRFSNLAKMTATWGTLPTTKARPHPDILAYLVCNQAGHGYCLQLLR